MSIQIVKQQIESLKNLQRQNKPVRKKIDYLETIVNIYNQFLICVPKQINIDVSNEIDYDDVVKKNVPIFYCDDKNYCLAHKWYMLEFTINIPFITNLEFGVKNIKLSIHSKEYKNKIVIQEITEAILENINYNII